MVADLKVAADSDVKGNLYDKTAVGKTVVLASRGASVP
jgi:hypothetical protein